MICAFSFAAAATGVLTYISRKFVVVSVKGDSMQPTYTHGDRVIAYRGAPPSRGDVVVIQRPDVWGIPAPPQNGGPHVFIDDEGLGLSGIPLAVRGVWPGKPIADPRSKEIGTQNWMIKRVLAVPGDPVPVEKVPILSSFPGDRVPAGKIVVLGDNFAASFDSRQVGYFPLGRVLGIAVGGRRRSVPIA
ncbi:S26 family signal peptidase [Streptomyces diastatochromogenes]|uniref:S26 family signal peptidase n=1 Tax=Streptomyces diastatochromogenes TaxID=42236 RepID=UPI0039BFAA03